MMNLILALVFSVSLVSCVSTNKKDSPVSLKEVKKDKMTYTGLTLIPSKKFKKKRSCRLSKSAWPKKDWKYFVDLGNSCLQSKKYKELLTIANYISIHYANKPWGPFFKSHYFTHKKLNLKALWLIDLAIQKSPNLGLLHYQKAIVLHKLKYVAAAKSSAHRAVSLNQNNFGAQLYLASLYLQSNQAKIALKHALIAQKLFPKNNEVNLLLSDIYFENKKYEEAVKYLSKIKRKKALANEIHFKLAYSYENLQQRSLSISHYKKIEARKKANLLAVYGLDVNEKIKEMELEIAKLEVKKRQPSNSDEKKNETSPPQAKEEGKQ